MAKYTTLSATDNGTLLRSADQPGLLVMFAPVGGELLIGWFSCGWSESEAL